MPISSCFLKLTLETRDNAQIEQIRQELTKQASSWWPSAYNLSINAETPPEWAAFRFVSR